MFYRRFVFGEFEEGQDGDVRNGEEGWDRGVRTGAEGQGGEVRGGKEGQGGEVTRKTDGSQSEGNGQKTGTDRNGTLIKEASTARFFPTNVYNDMFTDVVGHEWYAGAVECAYQNGMIDPGMVEDGKFFPLRPVTLEEFLVFAVNGYKSRRKLPDMDACTGNSFFVYDTRCREYTKPYVRAACALGLIPADGSETPDRVLTRGEAVALCRKLGL